MKPTVRLSTLYWLLLANSVGLVCSELCYVGFLDWDDCDYGCCDSYEYYKRCCTYIETQIGLIVGCIIGGLVFLACVIGAVVFFFCVYKKRQGHQGNVIHPNTNTIVTTQNQNYGPPPVNQPVPGYPQYTQPAYAQYPPGYAQPAQQLPQQSAYPPNTSTTQDGEQQKY